MGGPDTWENLERDNTPMKRRVCKELHPESVSQSVRVGRSRFIYTFVIERSGNETRNYVLRQVNSQFSHGFTINNYST